MSQGYTKDQPLDTDVNLGGASPLDYIAASQKATKTYVDNKLGTQDIVKVSKLVASDGSPDPALAADAAGDLSTAYNLALTGTSKAIKGSGSNFPALGTSTLAEKIGDIYLGTSKDVYPYDDEAGLFQRVANNWITYTDHLNSLPSLTWASYTGFTTPDTISVARASLMTVAHSAASRHFGYLASYTGTMISRISPARLSTVKSGIRIDDGTQNNYIQLFIESQSSGLVLYKYRQSNGGVEAAAVSLYSGQLFMPQFINLALSVSGTTVFMFIGLDTLFTTNVGSVTFTSWTPTRQGFYHEQNPGSVSVQYASVFDAYATA